MVVATRKKAITLKGTEQPAKIVGGGVASNEAVRMAKIERTLDQVATKTDTKRIESQMVSTASKSDLEKFATKSDLDKLANKRDLERFASLSDLNDIVKRPDLERVAKKQDLDKFAKKSDLEQFATKEDMERLESAMVSKEEAKRLQESSEKFSSESKSLRIWVIVGTICVLALTVAKVVEIIQSMS